MNIKQQSQKQQIPKLIYHNPKLYEELKQRQMQYINLIHDLHMENNRLRAMLKNTCKCNCRLQDERKFINQPQEYRSQNQNQFTIESSKNVSMMNKTPEFNSLNQSGIDCKYGLSPNQLFTNKIASERFSFTDVPLDHKSAPTVQNSQMKMLSILQSNPKISVQLRSLFSNFLQHKSQNMNNLAFSGNNIQNVVQQGRQKPIRDSKPVKKTVDFQENDSKYIIDQVNEQRLWKAETKKSIRDDARSSYNGDNYDAYDTVSEYSLICQSPKNSSGKIRQLIQRDSSVYKNKKNSRPSQQKLEVLQKYNTASNEGQNVMTLRSKPHIFNQNPKMHQQTKRTLKQRNRPMINNKIYL